MPSGRSRTSYSKFMEGVHATTSEREDEMQLDKQFVLDELRKEGQSAQVQKAIQELPDKIDHDKHAALLQKFGLDPGKLAAKAAERGLSSL
jgi:hypothetical protein